MKSGPLPAYLIRRRIEAEKFAKAILPGASEIDYIDALAQTPLRWHMLQVYQNGQYGILQYHDQSERFIVEFPYQLVLGQYNPIIDVTH